ncbi:helix-turn-helix domain-containing protein [Actinomadura yumaensis]|uniref:helix-turn-helix domain-containing protein n=1 Tax=Actinomadura yumaensis TaxID=111807 RepID=UPI003623711D
MTGAVRSRGPGRRPGPTETREAILASARELFAEKGYDGASLRAIAREAGVDPALVHHFFGNKEGVFIAAMRFPVDPGRLLPVIMAAPRSGSARRWSARSWRSGATPTAAPRSSRCCARR